jgi:hypothetical protein
MKHIVQQTVNGFLLTVNALTFLFKNPLFLIGSIILLLVPMTLSVGLEYILLTMTNFTRGSAVFFIIPLLNIFFFFVIAFGADHKLHHRPYTFSSLLKSIARKIAPLSLLALIWSSISWFIPMFLGRGSALINTTIMTILITYLSVFIADLVHEKGILETVKQSLLLIYRGFWHLIGGVAGICFFTFVPPLALQKITALSSDAIPYAAAVAIVATIIAWSLIMLCATTVFGVMLYQKGSYR